MALRNIVIEGDEILRKRSKEVPVVDDKIRSILDDMLETMRDENGEEEGCLSVPGVVGTVERPEFIKIKGLNRKGEEVTYEGTGLTAIAISHENDHLDGVLYIDKAIDKRSMDE